MTGKVYPEEPVEARKDFEKMKYYWDVSDIKCIICEECEGE